MRLLLVLLLVVGCIYATEQQIESATPSPTLKPPETKLVPDKIKRDDGFPAYPSVVGPEQTLPYNSPQNNFEHFFQNGLDDLKNSGFVSSNNINQARLAAFTSTDQNEGVGTQDEQQYAPNGGYLYANNFNHKELSANTEYNTAGADFRGNTESGLIGSSGNMKLENSNEFTSNSFISSVNRGYSGSSNEFSESFAPNNCGNDCLPSNSNSINQGYPSFNGCGEATSSSLIEVNSACGFQPGALANYPSYEPPQIITKEIRVPVPQPYPVTVEKKVPVPLPQPYLVQVPKPVPYRVEVRVPVPISKPYPVTVTQKVPIRVPVYVKVPQPVRIEVPRPYPVEKRVPYPIQVKVPVYIKVPVPAQITKFNQYQGSYQSYYEYPTPALSYGVPSPVYGPPGYQSGRALKKEEITRVQK